MRLANSDIFPMDELARTLPVSTCGILAPVSTYELG